MPGVMTVPMMTKHRVTEPVILAFEASGDQASAAVLTADGRQSVHHHMARHGHAAVITGLAELALQDCATDASGITHVTAGCGPGSFTGIRVALAAAKGFQIACNAVPVGLSCLAVMAHTATAGPATADPATAGSAGHDAQTVLATADTRRGSFFCQAFDANGAALGAILDVDPTRESDDPSGPVPDDQSASNSADIDNSGSIKILVDRWPGARVIGPGASLLAAASGGILHEDNNQPPLHALQVAQLASTLIAAGAPLPPLQPLYVAPAFLGPPRR